MLPCPACSLDTPDSLLCRHDSPVCPSCCAGEHPRQCPDCYGSGQINVTRAAKATYGAYIPGGLIGPNGSDIYATCETCDGHGRVNRTEENQ